MSGPPEFPGLIAASVCSALINEFSPAVPPAVTALSWNTNEPDASTYYSSIFRTNDS